MMSQFGPMRFIIKKQNFGIGEHSTSNIEHIWAHLKNMIKNIYKIIQKENYIYFIHEFLLNNSNRKNNEKIDIFKKILKNVYIT